MTSPIDKKTAKHRINNVCKVLLFLLLCTTGSNVQSRRLEGDCYALEAMFQRKKKSSTHTIKKNLLVSAVIMLGGGGVAFALTRSSQSHEIKNNNADAKKKQKKVNMAQKWQGGDFQHSPQPVSPSNLTKPQPSPPDPQEEEDHDDQQLSKKDIAQQLQKKLNNYDLASLKDNLPIWLSNKNITYYGQQITNKLEERDILKKKYTYNIFAFNPKASTPEEIAYNLAILLCVLCNELITSEKTALAGNVSLYREHLDRIGNESNEVLTNLRSIKENIKESNAYKKFFVEKSVEIPSYALGSGYEGYKIKIGSYFDDITYELTEKDKKEVIDFIIEPNVNLQCLKKIDKNRHETFLTNLKNCLINEIVNPFYKACIQEIENKKKNYSIHPITVWKELARILSEYLSMEFTNINLRPGIYLVELAGNLSKVRTAIKDEEVRNFCYTIIQYMAAIANAHKDLLSNNENLQNTYLKQLTAFVLS